MHTGANSATGCITLPDIVGHATGDINMGGQPFTIIGTNGFNAGTWASPSSKWDVLGSFSSYGITAPGDVGNNAVFSTSSTITPAKRVAIGFDDTNDVGIIQAIHAGVEKKGLILNPSGGWVTGGRGVWNEGGLNFLNGTYFWIDAFGFLRFKAGPPASSQDGNVVGAATGDITVSVSGTDLASITATINTTDKRPGKVVWNSSVGAAFRARGSAAGDIWDSLGETGSTITPA